MWSKTSLPYDPWMWTHSSPRLSPLGPLLLEDICKVLQLVLHCRPYNPVAGFGTTQLQSQASWASCACDTAFGISVSLMHVIIAFISFFVHSCVPTVRFTTISLLWSVCPRRQNNKVSSFINFFNFFISFGMWLMSALKHLFVFAPAILHTNLQPPVMGEEWRR